MARSKRRKVHKAEDTFAERLCQHTLPGRAPAEARSPRTWSTLQNEKDATDSTSFFGVLSRS